MFASVNPGVDLPHDPVVPVVRSDGSGTSYVFSEYCKTAEPNIWQAFRTFLGTTGQLGDDQELSADRPTSTWPIVNGMLGAISADGVAASVADPTSGEGRVTYNEAGFAKVRGFPNAFVQNSAGQFLQPDEPNVNAALSHATGRPDGTFQLDYTTPDPVAYFPSTYSYVIAQTTGFPADKGEVLARFLCYAVTKGQRSDLVVALAYARLSQQLVDIARDSIAKIPGAPPWDQCRGARRHVDSADDRRRGRRWRWWRWRIGRRIRWRFGWHRRLRWRHTNRRDLDRDDGEPHRDNRHGRGDHDHDHRAVCRTRRQRRLLRVWARRQPQSAPGPRPAPPSWPRRPPPSPPHPPAVVGAVTSQRRRRRSRAGNRRISRLRGFSFRAAGSPRPERCSPGSDGDSSREAATVPAQSLRRHVRFGRVPHVRSPAEPRPVGGGRHRPGDHQRSGRSGGGTRDDTVGRHHGVHRPPDQHAVHRVRFGRHARSVQTAGPRLRHQRSAIYRERVGRHRSDPGTDHGHRRSSARDAASQDRELGGLAVDDHPRPPR